MATITLENVPEPIYDQLRQRAREHGWTVDREAFNCLASYFSKETARDPWEVERLLEEIRKMHEGMKGDFYLTAEDVEAAINDGRE